MHSVLLNVCAELNSLTLHTHTEVFEKRVEEFKEWLFDRPESVIAVVAHWGLIYSLTKGVDFTNCVSVSSFWSAFALIDN